MPVVAPVIAFAGTTAGAATIAAGATLGAAALSSNAASKASKAQTAALSTANDTQQKQYDQTRADQAPWKDVGQQALSQLASGYGIQTHDINGNVTGGAKTAGTPDMSGFTASPDYQFTLNEGNRNLNAGYAAKGALESGAAQKAILKYGQDQASTQYGNYFNRLATLAGYGTAANSATEQAGQTAATNISNNAISLGNTKASSFNQQANTTNSALGQLTGILTNNYSTPALRPSQAVVKQQPDDGGFTRLPALAL